MYYGNMKYNINNFKFFFKKVSDYCIYLNNAGCTYDLFMGTYKNNKMLVQAALKKNPHKIKEVDMFGVINVDYPIQQILIHYGFKPFPSASLFYFLKQRPKTISMFIEKYSFEEIFSDYDYSYKVSNDYKSKSLQNFLKNREPMKKGSHNMELLQVLSAGAKFFSNNPLNQINSIDIKQTKDDNREQLFIELFKANFFVSSFFQSRHQDILNANAILGDSENLDSFLNIIISMSEKRNLTTLSTKRSKTKTL